jgi:type IV pilus assembly protein PilE
MKLIDGDHHISMDRYRPVHAGFTLIEVMITLVIVAVLMMVAVPMYENSMMKSRRLDGMRDLMELASRQERFYAQYSRYTDDVETAAGLNLNRTESSEGYYDVSVTECAGKDDDDFSACYVISAVPKGVQTGDLSCGTLSVNSLGQRSASGPLGEKCW